MPKIVSGPKIAIAAFSTLRLAHPPLC